MTDDLTERLEAGFATDLAKTPATTLRSGNSVDSYGASIPFHPEIDVVSDEYLTKYCWGVTYLDAMPELFPGHEADVQEASVDDLVSEQKKGAMAEMQNQLAARLSMPFSEVVDGALEAFMLRETNIKDICVDLATAGTIERTWGGGNRKPRDTDVIRLKQ
jgi:hypothetical protein